MFTTADILDRVAPKLNEQGLTYECLGGGRIRHDSRSKMISIYGYSVVGEITHTHPAIYCFPSMTRSLLFSLEQGFGMANHKITVGLVRQKYSDYSPDNITFSNSGY